MQDLTGRARRLVVGAAAIGTIAVTVRAIASHALVSSLLVGGAAVIAVLVGLALYGRHHEVRWRLAWTALALGLTAQVVGTVLQALDETGSAASVAGLSGGVLVATGLVVLIHHRGSGRATEFLFEAVIGAVGSGYVLWVLAPGTAAGTGTLLGALGLLAVDVAVLWLAARLASMTTETPAVYRYLLIGLVVRLTADAVALGGLLGPLSQTLHGSAQWRALVLWGYCLWAAGALHPSMRRSFEPVSSPSRRLGVGRIAFVTLAVLVPAAALALQGVGAGGIAPTTVAGSMLPPLVVAAYLIHQVQERASREYRAQHDALTGLPNRVLFHDRVEVALTQARRRGHRVGLMFLDLDRFKNINDSLGHDVGNELLQAVAKRLRATLREEDTVARLGGDEFTILLSAIDDADECTLVARKVASAFDDPFFTAGRELFVSASVGVAVFPDSAEDAETLLKNADTAMYSAKAHGRNGVQRYSQDMSARASVKLALESSLHGAVERGRLTVHYQPQVDLRDGRIVGLEALARWYHPELGFVSPAAFIPLAEESGLILELGERVLNQACRQNQRWHEAGLLSVPVAVNISPRQFTNGRVLSTVAEALDRSGLPPELLELELTEGVFMRDMATATEILEELRAMGIRCSIDDFGTGFSALNYLAALPIDALKIDRSFVQAIADEHDEAPIVGAVIALAHQLGMRVIAEGVETTAQSRHLRRAGCQVMQGYRFGRPVPAEELEQRLLDERLVTGIPEDELGPILSGPSAPAVVDIDDAPDPAAVTALLVSAVSEGDGAELDPEVLDTVLQALRPDRRSTDQVWWRRGASLRLAAGSLAGLLPISGGLAAAGALPSSAQSVAHEVLGHVGVHVPAGPGTGGRTPIDGQILLAAQRYADVPAGSVRAAGAGTSAAEPQPDDPPAAALADARPAETPTTATVAAGRRTAEPVPAPEHEEGRGAPRTRPAGAEDAERPETPAGRGHTDETRPGASGSTPAEEPSDTIDDTTGDTATGGADEGTAPGNSGDAPGQSDDTPGQSNDTPGNSGGTPGQNGGPPGNSGDTPGQSGDTPRQEETPPTDPIGGGDDAPGNSGDTPGQDGNTPGQNDDTPGQNDDTPGQSGDTPRQEETPPADPIGGGGDAPGNSGDTPGQSGDAPGQSGDTPGQSGDAPGQDGSTPARAATHPARTAAPPARAATHPARTAAPPARAATHPARTAAPPARAATHPARTAAPPARAATHPARTAAPQDKKARPRVERTSPRHQSPRRRSPRRRPRTTPAVPPSPAPTTRPVGTRARSSRPIPSSGAIPRAVAVLTPLVVIASVLVSPRPHASDGPSR